MQSTTTTVEGGEMMGIGDIKVNINIDVISEEEGIVALFINHRFSKLIIIERR